MKLFHQIIIFSKLHQKLFQENESQSNIRHVKEPLHYT